MDLPKWGPTGQEIYRRTYSRPNGDGTRESWPDTVSRVVTGNLSLVHGDPETWSDEVRREATQLIKYIYEFKILPAGRHLRMSGIKGRQYLFNCHVAGWDDDIATHFIFTYLRLAEGGGVGANYASEYTNRYVVRNPVRVHVVCSAEHPDYAEMARSSLLSPVYTSDVESDLDVEDSREGWADALALTLRRSALPIAAGAGSDRIIVDVSRVRARGSRIKAFGGTASGPAPLAEMLTETCRILQDVYSRDPDQDEGTLTPLDAMEIDHAIAACVVSGNVRRSARMSIVPWNDTHIDRFLGCKANPAHHWTTNISVEIDDLFVGAVSDELHPQHLAATRVLRQVVTGMLTNGEPGLWNSSLSQIGEVGQVHATNPCGEIALEPWENCNLGHVNLDAFAADPEGLVDAHRLMTRFLLRATYGDITDGRQRDIVARNRRIGVGHFGAQGWLAKLGVKYSESYRNPAIVEILEDLQDAVRSEAADEAFRLRIPEPVKVTAIAPTGTVAKLPGRTEGWHPIYSRYFVRRVRYGLDDPGEAAEVERLRGLGHHVEDDLYNPRTVVVEFATRDALVDEVDEALLEQVDEISLEDMLGVQAMVQSAYADNAVSFTINVPAEPHQVQAMADGQPVPPPTHERVVTFTTALTPYLSRLKGTTVMLDGSRPQAPYERITKVEYDAAADGGVDASYDPDCASGACPV